VVVPGDQTHHLAPRQTHGRAVPAVQVREQEDAAAQERHQHRHAVQDVQQTVLHIEMTQNDPERDEWRAGFDEKTTAQQTVPLPSSQVHHHWKTY